MQLICKTVFGSRLYGTQTPTSDEDVRGIFLPDKQDVLLGRIPRTSKDNAGKEEDFELYSLHHFVKLACDGQTVAFDMLWTPESMTELGECGQIWTDLRQLRHKFLSKRMNAFIGYARGQAAKYSLKGNRLKNLEAFLGGLSSADGESIMALYMHCLPYDDVRTNIQGVKEVQIAGMWFGATTKVQYVREACERKLSAYGKRASAAAIAGGIDWKAVSHAVRVSAELLDLMRHGEIKFPLPYSDQILAVKLGQVPLEKVQDVLDGLLDEVEVITAASSLPEEVDRNFWNDWLANETQEALFPEVWMYNRLCK